MKARIIAYTLLAIILGFLGPGEAQSGTFRIGYLDPSTQTSNAAFLEAFRQEMNKLGWIEGKNIAIEYRFAEQEQKRLPD